MKTAKQPQQWLWSAVGVAIFVALLHVVVDWHQNAKMHQQLQHMPPILSKRQLIQDAPSAITDDTTRDETCRKYIWNFLNGTTDARDECDGLYNAFKAADCKDDSHLNNYVWKQHKGADGNMTDDDVVIDDDFESWECCESITDYYEKNCQDKGLDAVKLLGIVSVLVISGFMRSFVRMWGIQWVPDAGVCIVVGAITGGIMRLISADVVQNRFAFDNDLFLQILLPPIIFQAALTIDKRAFRRDLFPILSFAVIGTGVSAVAIGLITYHLSGWMHGSSLPLLDSLLFGALMSSIDPVATLNILTSVGVSQSDTLYTLIFGESLLNDGVSIVLFDSLVRHAGDADVVDSATVNATLQDFFVVIFGSILVGVGCAGLTTLYFWFLQGKQTPVAEVGLFFMWALVPYYIADGLKLSGIISIMVMGLMVDYYVLGGNVSEERQWMEYMEMRHPSDVQTMESRYLRIQRTFCSAFSGCGHLHSKSRRHVGFVAEVISSLMETAIFVYLGLFLFNEQSWDFLLMAAGIFACVTSRAGVVMVLSLLVNACVWIDLEPRLGRLWQLIRSPTPTLTMNDDDTLSSDTKAYLDRRTQLIIFSAGVRGAVSYALVQNIPVYNSVTKHGSHFKGELKAMTSATIVVLLFTFGAITYYSVRRDWSPSGDHIAGPLTHRLMSDTLASDDGLDESGEIASLEIEGGPQSRPRLSEHS